MKRTIILPTPVPSKKNSRIIAKGKSFPSAAYKRWEQDARWEARLQWQGMPLGGYVAIHIDAYGLRNDADNLAASVLDALEGICYNNDRQIEALTVERHKSREKRCVVTVSDLPEHD